MAFAAVGKEEVDAPQVQGLVEGTEQKLVAKAEGSRSAKEGT